MPNTGTVYQNGRAHAENLLEAGVSPVAPGAIFEANFIIPENLDIAATARKMGLPVEVLQGVIEAVIPVDDQIAFSLGKFTDTSPKVWLGMQADFDHLTVNRGG